MQHKISHYNTHKPPNPAAQPANIALKYDKIPHKIIIMPQNSTKMMKI